MEMAEREDAYRAALALMDEYRWAEQPDFDDVLELARFLMGDYFTL